MEHQYPSTYATLHEDVQRIARAGEDIYSILVDPEDNTRLTIVAAPRPTLETRPA